MDYSPPANLEDADATLTAFARWQRMGGRSRGRCGSAEGRYRSTDVHVGAAVPVVLIPDWSAAEVQRALVACPEQERTLLALWYSGHVARLAKMRRLAKWSSEETSRRLDSALAVFDSHYRRKAA